jgi:hypothetical protein
MTETSHILHTAKLKNNCPECYHTDSLELSFSQVEKEHRLYNKASGEITSVMHCSNCNTVIYPVNWNEDLEKVFEYHRKLANPKPSGTRLKPLAYTIIFAGVIAIVLLVYLLK